MVLKSPKFERVETLNAYDYLQQVKDADARIDEKNAELQEFLTLATSVIHFSDGMPRARGVADTVGNTASKIIKARENAIAQIDKYMDIRADVIRHIEMLPPKQRTVLHWLYVRKREKRGKNQSWYYTWREIAENLGCTEQNIDHIRKRAIKNLQKILDAEQKNNNG
jgi:DNA-directed RNA polymerase specialized sigma subunit